MTSESVTLPYSLRATYITRAQIARDAYRSAGHDLAALIRASTSGVELIDAGFAVDVEMAISENASIAALRLIEGAYRLG